MPSKSILLVSAPRNYPMRNEMWPSGALMMLGTILKKEGHTVKLLHMVADRIDGFGFPKILKEFNPDIVGFTVSTFQAKMTRVLLRIVKVFNEKVLTVVGGSHPSALGAEYLTTYPNADIAVYGEGEKAIMGIANDVPLSEITGIHYRNGDKIITNAPTPMLTNLDSLPLPDKSLINFRRFSGLYPVGRRPCMFIMSSRGCPFRCTFCSKSIYGNTLRQRSPEHTMSEIDLLYRDWGIKDLMFQDDTFNANRQWADRLLDLIIAGGYNKKLVFRVAMRVNEKMVDLDLLKHLKAAGVWIVYYGIENGNQAMLDRMHKGITIEEVKRAFALTKSVGLKAESGFLIGMPGETRQTIQDSCNLWKTIRPYWGGFSRVIPFPGTPFTKEIKETGHLLSEDYENFKPSSMVVRTDTMTAKELDDSMPAIRRMVRLDEIRHPKQVVYLLLDKVRGKE